MCLVFNKNSHFFCPNLNSTCFWKDEKTRSIIHPTNNMEVTFFTFDEFHGEKHFNRMAAVLMRACYATTMIKNSMNKFQKTDKLTMSKPINSNARYQLPSKQKAFSFKTTQTFILCKLNRIFNQITSS